MQRTEREIHHLTPVTQRLLSTLYLSPFAQTLNDYTDRDEALVSLVVMKNRTYLPFSGHIQTRYAFVDNFEFVTNKAFHVQRFASAVLIGQLLGNLIGSSFCAWYRHEMAAVAAAVLRWLKHHSRSQQCTICRQCTTCVLCGRCLSQFQICVCVSGLVSLLPVSTFSLRQSASTVIKSLSSPKVQVLVVVASC